MIPCRPRHRRNQPSPAARPPSLPPRPNRPPANRTNFIPLPFHPTLETLYMRPTASTSPMKTLRNSRHATAIALALSASLLAGALTTPTTLRAQAVSPADAASQKMQLMLQAIDARSAGDYAKARDLFAQLLA